MEYPLLLEMSQIMLVGFDLHCCTTDSSCSGVSTVTSTPPVPVIDMFTCVDYEFFTVVSPKRDILNLSYYEAIGHIEKFKLKAVIG